MERDKDGSIVSQRRRDMTVVRQAGCEWFVRVSYMTIGKRGSGVKGWVLKVKCLDHSGHELSENPLSFHRHRQRLEEYQKAAAQARQHRSQIIPYLVSRRVLESEEFGITLTAREYYNSVRFKSVDKDDSQTI